MILDNIQIIKKSAFENLRNLRAIIQHNYEKYTCYWYGQSWLISWNIIG
jgi:hypothetical protein